MPSTGWYSRKPDGSQNGPIVVASGPTLPAAPADPKASNPDVTTPAKGRRGCLRWAMSRMYLAVNRGKNKPRGWQQHGLLSSRRDELSLATPLATGPGTLVNIEDNHL